MRRTPALIVGGGPAGATAALLLARAGAPHLLIERSRETGDALCGGFLSWRTLQALERLGIERHILNREAVCKVRLLKGERSAEAPLPAPALAVSRRRLDTVLLDLAIASGASVERGVAVREIAPTGVRLADSSEIAADSLFAANGKHDLRGLGRDQGREADPMLGLRVRLAASPALTRLVGDAIELHLFRGGYAGIVRQEDGTANLCMAVRRSRLAASGSPDAMIADLGAESPRLGERLAHCQSGSVDAVANVPYGWRATEGVVGLFRLGDQAACIPSLAGEGMGIAIESARRAAAAYLRGGTDAAPRYQHRLALDLARPLTIAGAIAGTAQSPAIAAAMVSIVRRMPQLAGIAARLTRISHIPA